MTDNTQTQALNAAALTQVTALSSQSTAFQNLNQSQQDLLLAALNSQKPLNQSPDPNSLTQQNKQQTMSLTQSPSRMAMDPLDADFTPDMYDFDGDNSFDFDNADLGGQMIGALPDDDEGEQREKRKNPDDPSTPEGDAKRQETQEGEKGSKKPGRKPLTSEPTTKRKAQNRAAQRAFRERKEKHLKDLETQVTELTKSQEADKHENGLLRAQVDRLQVELREYRKRLSLNSGASRSPPVSSSVNQARNSFSFDFPKFGSLPQTQILGGAAASITPPLSSHSPASNIGSQPQLSRHNSENRSMSPGTVNPLSSHRSPSQVSNQDLSSTANFLPYSTNDNMHGFASTLPQMGKSNNDPFGDLFSPSILKSVAANNQNSYFNPASNAPNTNLVGNGGDSTAGIPDHRVFRFNSSSMASDSASPSASSSSQWNNNTTNSSCGTSPEPLNDSPAIKDKSLDISKSNAADQFSFTHLPNQTKSNDFNFTNLDANAFNVPQTDSFDPVLFGDYRESNDSIVGGGDFTGGFFDDGVNSAPIDFGSPSTLFGILAGPSPNAQSTAPTPSRNLMAEMDKARDGGDDDFGLPAQQPAQPAKAVEKSGGKLISCTKIWNQLQSNPDFQDGKFDLDGLCSELRTKARCSESGLMVDSDHVDAALKKLTNPAKPDDAAKKAAWLMFEQESWDNVLKKLNSGKENK